MKFRFTPEDFWKHDPEFRPSLNMGDMAKWAADIANAKLEEWLKDAPTVFTETDINVAPMCMWTYRGILYLEQVEPKFKGKLVCIEEINPQDGI